MSTNTAKPKKPARPAQRPEMKVGPFQGGIGVAVWLNEIQTDAGPKKVRSVTISPRRYLEKQTGLWKDAASFRPGDISALILGLEKALEFVLSVPLPGEQSEDERLTGVPDNGEIPY